MKFSLVSLNLCAALFFWSGCTYEDDTESVDSDRIPLVVQTQKAGFGNAAGDGKETRASVIDSGPNGAFEPGDAIGLYVLRSGHIVDEIENVKLVYRNSGEWSRTDGLPLYYYGEGAEYIAYYPYREDDALKFGNYGVSATVIPDGLAARWESLFRGSNFSDQTTAEKHNAADLMIAKGALSDLGIAPVRKALKLDFEHKFSLVTLDFRRKRTAQYTPPAGKTFKYHPYLGINPPFEVEYSSDAEGDHYTNRITSVTLNIDAGSYQIEAFETGNGLFRAIVPVNEKGIFGVCFIDNSDKVTFDYNAPSQFQAGKRYHLQVVINRGESVSARERPLQVGDLYFRDGTIVPGDEILGSGSISESWVGEIRRNCIGIVAAVVNPLKNDAVADEMLAVDHPECTNGLVIALESVPATYIPWSLELYSVSEWYVNLHPSEPGINRDGEKICGYRNTKIIQMFNNSDPVKYQHNLKVLPVEYIKEHESSYPAPATSSGWYLPSYGEFERILSGSSDRDLIFQTDADLEQFCKMAANTLQNEQYFLSSSEEQTSSRQAVIIADFVGLSRGGNIKNFASDASPKPRTRYTLAF